MAPASKSDAGMADCADATAPEPVVAKPKRSTAAKTNKRTASDRVAATKEEKPARRVKTAGELGFYQVQVLWDTPWDVLAIVGARDLDEARAKVVAFTNTGDAAVAAGGIWAEKLTLSSEGVHSVGYGQSVFQLPGSRTGLHLFYAHGFQSDADGEPGIAVVIAQDYDGAQRLVLRNLSERHLDPMDLRIDAVELTEDTMLVLNNGHSANHAG